MQHERDINCSLEDDNIIERLHNEYSDAVRVSSDNLIKKKLMEDIYNGGFRVTTEREFHQIDTRMYDNDS